MKEFFTVTTIVGICLIGGCMLLAGCGMNPHFPPYDGVYTKEPIYPTTWKRYYTLTDMQLACYKHNGRFTADGNACAVLPSQSCHNFYWISSPKPVNIVELTAMCNGWRENLRIRF